MFRGKFTRVAVVAALTIGSAAAAMTVSASAATTGFEAENAQLSQAVVATNHPGFTGTGFVDYTNVTGSYVEFSVPASQAGTVTLTFRFANGSTANRPMDVSVNGTLAAGGVGFAPTGDWSTWKTQSVGVLLSGSTNLIRVTATTANGGPNLDSLTVSDQAPPPPDDWSVNVVTSETTRKSPSELGGWGYTQGLYLYGQYLVWQRTHNPKYLSYIKAWADRFVDSSGNISNSFNNLDSMQSGNVLLILFKETGDQRYMKAAKKIHDRFPSYPKTSDGGFWHGTSRPSQLWGDGVFMLTPFMVHYGAIVGDTANMDNQAADQLIIYDRHLLAPGGLHYHAYDEAAAQSWVVPGTHHSPEQWCRANGWYAMAITEVLEYLPASHPKRAQLVSIMQRMVAGMKATQDQASGLWFQVVDKGSRSDNWTETSCSSMFTYTISRAVQRGYVDSATYKPVADKGYQGILRLRVSKGSDGLTNITQICVGTNVGDYPFYIARTRATNDLHGLGSFLIMNEQLQFPR
jgi:unsaturated rhamnogalacturonyl hydrolase